ncbi:MAG: hypothetical protein JNL85_11790 [Rubrivivax sp.]|nr:hypothetical protein [Rubrivivax sp.]
MHSGPGDLAQVRLDNALLLFEEFVRATARHADAAALRGLERRFAERVQIQPSYWSQIKSRSRQIGERLARQFEQLMHKPRGWMDVAHGVQFAAPTAGGESGLDGDHSAADAGSPRDEDERFIVGLVLTYYRRHPQHARARLLDLLGEVLVQGSGGGPAAKPGPGGSAARSAPSALSARVSATTPEVDEQALWRRAQSGVAPLKRKK